MFTTKSLFVAITLVCQMFIMQPINAAIAQDSPLQHDMTDRIDAYIHARMEAAGIPGLALGIVKGDQVAYLKGYGVAGSGRVVTPQISFILGSTSKSFTALAIMQLAEAGKIDLESPVTKYLPWFRTSDTAASAQITVRNLLNHNSGFPTYNGRQGLWSNDQSDAALENSVRSFASIQLNRPAGQGYEYANENYDTLGLIVQTVSGMSYEDYVRAKIFDPLQMHHSAAMISDPAVADIATGYRQWLFWPLAFDAPYPRSTTPAGFLISSAEDMAHYLVAQLNGGSYDKQQLVSPHGIDALHTPGAKINNSEAYGMGWVIQGQPGSTKIWHNGDVSNFHSNLLLLPDQHLGIVILTNINEFYNSTGVNIPIEGVADILLGKDITARTNPSPTILPQLLMLTMPLLLTLWIAGSYLGIMRWRQRCQQDGQAQPGGMYRFWRLGLPLVIDLSPIALTWFVLPTQFEAPMESIALFVPDAFAVIVVLTILSLSWAMTRILLTAQADRFSNPSIQQEK